jgi:hypothetical protein
MWSEQDETDLKRLVKKRREYLPESGYDFKFMSDLLHGEEGENIVKDAFVKAEVKRDMGAWKTGNIYVEHESWQKPSGIATTDSEYVIYLLGGGFNDEVFIGMKTKRLKTLLSQIKWITRGGDAKSSKGKLLRLSQLLRKTMVKKEHYCTVCNSDEPCDCGATDAFECEDCKACQHEEV